MKGRTNCSTKMLNCVVVLDKHEFDCAAAKYLVKKSPEHEDESPFMGFGASDDDSDDDRLQIDESVSETAASSENKSMPVLEVDGDVAKVQNTKAGIQMEWASENNPKYGYAKFVPKEPRKRGIYRRKQYVEAGSQYNKKDCQGFCDECLSGKLTKKFAMKASIDVKLEEYTDITIDALTKGGKITPDLFEKVKKLVESLEVPKVQVKHMQMKRITTKSQPPALLPLPNISNPIHSTTQNESTSSTAFARNDAYVEEFHAFQTIVDPLDRYQFENFFGDAIVSSTTSTPSYEPTFTPQSFTPNFYVNAMDPETTNNNETEEIDLVQEDDEPETRNEEKKSEDGHKDMFQIDESDKDHVERNGASAEVEVFPEMTPIGEHTPAKVETPGDDDAIDIYADDDFGKEFEDQESPLKESVPKNNNLERQSILTDNDNEKPSTSRGSRFSKIGHQNGENPSGSNGNKRKASPSPFKNRTFENKRFKRNNRSVASPWEDTVSPFKSGLFPQQQQQQTSGFHSSTTASQQLFAMFQNICRNKMYSECMGGITCNQNHEFPDSAKVAQLLHQMQATEVQKFVTSIYKSIPCSILYFPVLAKYFGNKNMKHHLVDAITNAESHVLLLQNYKWIVDGLIRTGVAIPIAIKTLLENRKNISYDANKIIVEIIVKTNMELNFLNELLIFSETSVNIFTLDMFHKFMETAMRFPAQIDSWEILIGNILDALTDQGLNSYFDEKLTNDFIQWLEQQRGGVQN